jgi:hypothetical protein
MATLSNSYFDIIDADNIITDDRVGAVIELLMAENQILADAAAMECNKGHTHQHTIRTGLPSVAWGALYQGIAQSKSRTQMVEDTTGFLEGLSDIDCRLLELHPGNESQIRLNEGMGFIEAMNQEMATGMFYHDTATTPEKFKGLAARYNTLTGKLGTTSNQIVDAGGTGSDNTSVWFVTWGDRQTHILYPKGTQAGVKREDMGKQRVLDDEGKAYYVEEEKFSWHMGLAVKDWRYNSRIANIDVSELRAGNVDIYKFMRQAYYKLQSRQVADGRQAIYCNADVLEALDAAAVNQGASDNFTRLRPMEIQGQKVLTYRGIPIRECEALLNTEARVV